MSKIIVPEHIANGGFLISDSLSKKFKAIKQKNKAEHAEAWSQRSNLAAGQDTADQVTAIDDHLVSSGSLSGDQQDMYAQSLLFIEHAAIGHAKFELNWTAEKIANPDVRNTKEWWDVIAYVAVNHCPWINIDLMVNDSCHNVTRSGDIDMGKIISDVMLLVAGTEAAAQAAALAKTFSNGDGGTEVDNVGHFFWNQKTTAETKCELSTSPAIGDVNENVSYAYAFLYMNHTEKNWRSLFFTNHYDSFTYSVVSFRMQMLKSTWIGSQSDVLDQINPWIKTAIKDAKLA